MAADLYDEQFSRFANLAGDGECPSLSARRRTLRGCQRCSRSCLAVLYLYECVIMLDRQAALFRHRKLNVAALLYHVAFIVWGRLGSPNVSTTWILLFQLLSSFVTCRIHDA